MAFSPATQKVQLDENWSCVAKKQKHCNPAAPADARGGDCWDLVALDPGHRLILSVVVGKRAEDHALQLVDEVYERTDRRLLNLITADEYPAYATAIARVYAETAPPGTPAAVSLPEWRGYATVHKTREQNRVVKGEARLIFGTVLPLAAALVWAVLPRATTVFVERSNGTDRHRTSREVRKTYRFSKDWKVHEAMTYFTLDSGNFCWSVQTLGQQVAPQRYRERTPAMVAGLTEHVWSLEEWLLFPGSKRQKLPPFPGISLTTPGEHDPPASLSVLP